MISFFLIKKIKTICLMQPYKFYRFLLLQMFVRGCWHIASSLTKGGGEESREKMMLDYGDLYVLVVVVNHDWNLNNYVDTTDELACFIFSSKFLTSSNGLLIYLPSICDDALHIVRKYKTSIFKYSAMMYFTLRVNS